VLTRHVDHQVHGTGLLARINKAVAVKITVWFGSMWALYFLVVWMLAWMGWQQSGVLRIIHDPYPFVFLLFLSNLVQLWALPALMVGQNVLAAHSDARAEADHETLCILHEINNRQLEILLRVEKLEAQERAAAAGEASASTG
jgi:uncharacterized membrane protein